MTFYCENKVSKSLPVLIESREDTIQIGLTSSVSLYFFRLSMLIPDVQIVSIAEDIRHQTRVATAGENIVLVCGIDVEDKSNVVWQRNGVDLVDVQLLDGMKVRGLPRNGDHLGFRVLAAIFTS